MMNLFMAGPELVSWDLLALGPQGTGPYRLTVNHAAGTITEHFETVATALSRQGELEQLLLAARGPGRLETGSDASCDDDTGSDAEGKRQPTILVVDDDHTVTDTFATALNREGFHVRTAANAETALLEATAHHTDAIIVDLRMPLINGLGFLYRLRTRDEHRHTPVAIVTGSIVDDELAAEVTELGAELRFKPLWIEDVVELAHRLVARPAAS
jgi:CheY-like chemotaxis protein